MGTPHLTPFELIGADGGPLRGDVRAAPGTAGRPAVVICHGFKGFKDWGFFPHLADRLARAGCVAVSFNFSGSGVGLDGEHFTEPERFGRATFSRDLADLDAVVAALRDGGLVPGLRTPTRLGLFGHSRGGGTALLHTSAAGAAVDALVTWSAVSKPLRWGRKTLKQWRRDGKLDIKNMRTGEVMPLYTDLLDELEEDTERRFDMLRAAARIAVPWLIVHGEVDEAVPVKEAHALWQASEQRAELVSIPHGSHTFGARHPWAGFTPELDRAMEATADWFLRCLF